MSSHASAPTLQIPFRERNLPWIVEAQDPEGVRRVPLLRSMVVGSSRSADLRIFDRTVSGRHCHLEVHPGGVAVFDLGSKNGTFVGGARVKEASATNGTVLTLGQTSVVLSEVDESEADVSVGEPLPGVAGKSLVMRGLADCVRRLARYMAPVLILGENGTGKELIARSLHTFGPRSEGPFVPMNMASLPRELVESEMFGHERGAFTGAVARKLGAFAEAQGGTLFMDEIGELPLDAQPKLLRVLDGYEMRRVGASGPGVRADARIVTATNVPLEAAVLSGKFRRDLYHRLEVHVLHIPPLRERRGDIPAIARSLLASVPESEGCTLTSSAIARLVGHDWPGNVRDLRNVLCRAADLAREDGVIHAHMIERSMRASQSACEKKPMSLTTDMAKSVLALAHGNMSAAARAAGMPRSSFRKLVTST